MAHKTRDATSGPSCAAHQRAAFDLCVAVQESLRTAVFNLRCDSISATKRRCFPFGTLHVIWNLHGHLWGFRTETCWLWTKFYFSQRARWSGEGVRSFFLSLCVYSERLGDFISCVQGNVEPVLLLGFREPFAELHECRRQADEE